MDIEQIIKRHGWTFNSLSKFVTNSNGKKGVAPCLLYKTMRNKPALYRIKEIADIMQIPVLQLIAEIYDLKDYTDNTDQMTRCPHCGEYICINVETNIKINKV